MAQEEKTEKSSHSDFLIPARLIVGVASTLMMIFALYSATISSLGRSLTLAELLRFPLMFILGMLVSVSSFLGLGWWIVSFTSKLLMILGKRNPVSFWSVIWFLVTVIWPWKEPSKIVLKDVTVMRLWSVEITVSMFILIFLLTDILDAVWWAFGIVEDEVKNK